MKKAVPIVVVAAVIAGIIIAARFAGPPPENAQPGNGGANGEGDGPVIIEGLGDAEEIIIEAEDIKYDSVWKVRSSGDCSGGKYAYVPEGPIQAELNPRWKTKEGKPIPWQELETTYKNVERVHNGVGKIDLDVETAGDYIMWMRCRWLHGCADSVGFAVDGGEEIAMGGSTYKRWKWHCPKGEEEEYRRFKLAEGKHTLTLYNREDGSEVDQILFTTEDVVPQGIKSPSAGADE